MCSNGHRCIDGSMVCGPDGSWCYNPRLEYLCGGDACYRNRVYPVGSACATCASRAGQATPKKPAPATTVVSGAVEKKKQTASKGTGTCAFGTTCRPSNPDLGGAREDKQVITHNATDQLKSVVKSGEEANRKGISDEEAKAKSNCQFDDKGCGNYEPNPPINKVPGQSPEAMGLADRVKKVTSDPAMAANLQWYLDLDRQLLNKQADIAAFQKEIDKGNGDPAILNVHKKSLENDLARSKADQVNVVQQMKDQGQKLNITIDWNEAPSK
jgi:hypothetical protein